MVVRRMVALVVERRGHEVVKASNGREALDKLAAGQFDIVISDAKMPKLDGFGLLAEMRGVPEYEKIPMILITARMDAYASVGPEQLSSAVILPKPISSEELLGALGRLLNGNDG